MNQFKLVANVGKNGLILPSGDLKIRLYEYSKNVNPKTGKPHLREFDVFVKGSPKWLRENLHEGDYYEFSGFLGTFQRAKNKTNDAGESISYVEHEMALIATDFKPIVTKVDRPLVVWYDMQNVKPIPPAPLAEDAPALVAKPKRAKRKVVNPVADRFPHPFA